MSLWFVEANQRVKKPGRGRARHAGGVSISRVVKSLYFRLAGAEPRGRGSDLWSYRDQRRGVGGGFFFA